LLTSGAIQNKNQIRYYFANQSLDARVRPGSQSSKIRLPNQRADGTLIFSFPQNKDGTCNTEKKQVLEGYMQKKKKTIKQYQFFHKRAAKKPFLDLSGAL
jgi:hypothetical protein